MKLNVYLYQTVIDGYDQKGEFLLRVPIYLITNAKYDDNTLSFRVGEQYISFDFDYSSRLFRAGAEEGFGLLGALVAKAMNKRTSPGGIGSQWVLVMQQNVVVFQS